MEEQSEFDKAARKALLTPARRAAGVAWQDDLRKLFGGRVPKTVGERNHRWGFARVRLGADQLRVLPPDDLAGRRVALERIAEGFALMGDFEFAVGFTPSEHRLKEYADRAGAMANRGFPTCECPVYTLERDPHNAKGNKVTVRLPVGKVWSEKTGHVEFSRCRLCGAIDAN